MIIVTTGNRILWSFMASISKAMKRLDNKSSCLSEFNRKSYSPPRYYGSSTFRSSQYRSPFSRTFFLPVSFYSHPDKFIERVERWFQFSVAFQLFYILTDSIGQGNFLRPPCRRLVIPFPQGKDQRFYTLTLFNIEDIIVRIKRIKRNRVLFGIGKIYPSPDLLYGD